MNENRKFAMTSQSGLFYTILNDYAENDQFHLI